MSLRGSIITEIFDNCNVICDVALRLHYIQLRTEIPIICCYRL